MPRFDFESFLEGSATSFSNFDMYPQAEWETKKQGGRTDKDFVTGNVTNSADTKSHTSSDDSGSSSPTLRDLENSLMDMKHITSDYSDSGSDTVSSARTKLESPCHRPHSPRDSGLHSTWNASEDTNLPPPRASTPAKTQTTPMRRRIATPEKYTSPPINKDTREQDSSTASPVVMVLNDEYTFRPICADDNISEIISQSQQGTNTPRRAELDEAFHKLFCMPINKLTHFASIGEYTRTLHEKGHLNDVFIHVGTRTFGAHRVALASFSTYLAEVFIKHDVKNKIPFEIRLKGISAEAFSVFLEYVYTGEIGLHTDILVELAAAADQLGVSQMRLRCAEYVDNMSMEVALSMIQSTHVQPSASVCKRAYSIVVENFSVLNNWAAFLRLDIRRLCQVLSDDNLVIASEMEVFMTILNWIAHSQAGRVKCLTRLMSCVRFPYMQAEELFRCVEISDIFRADETCQEMVLHAGWIIFARKLGRRDPLKFPSPSRRRFLRQAVSELSDMFMSAHTHSLSPLTEDIETESPSFASDDGSHKKASERDDSETAEMGSSRSTSERGAARGSTDSGSPGCRFPKGDPGSVLDETVEVNLEARDTNGDLRSTSSHSSQSSTTSVGAKRTSSDILAMGGFQTGKRNDKNIEAKCVERYSASENQWMKYTNIPHTRYHHAVTILGTHLYLVGGTEKLKKHSVPTKSCFRFDLDSSLWRTMASMNTGRMYHSVVELYGLLYAIGGQEDKHRVLNSVECYNPISDNWFYVKSMATARLGMGATVKEGKLYVAGGYGESIDKKSGMPVLNTVECFNPRTNTWTSLNNLRFARCHANLLNVCGDLYICGGATRSYTYHDSVLTSVAAVDVYNSKMDAWEHVTNMGTARHCAGGAVLGNKIFIIGGVSTVGGDMIQSIECYDVISDQWMSDMQSLPYPARWLSCVSVPNKHLQGSTTD